MFKVRRNDGVWVYFLVHGEKSKRKLSKSNISPAFAEVMERVAETLPLVPLGKTYVADLEDYGDVFYYTSEVMV